MRYLLFYEYVADIAERRAPLRPAHLRLLADLHARGLLFSSGPYNDAPAGALFIFADRAAAEQFMLDDPYALGGLVAGHRIREWSVVVGS